jgi:hypothetical protein
VAAGRTCTVAPGERRLYVIVPPVRTDPIEDPTA